MLNAQTGKLIKDYFIGGPLNVLPSIGATASGQMEVIVPITAGILSWGTAVPGDLVVLTLQNVPASSATSVTTNPPSPGPTVTTTVATTITATAAASAGSDTLLYGVATTAVIAIIAAGYFAMRGRKPAS